MQMVDVDVKQQQRQQQQQWKIDSNSVPAAAAAVSAASSEPGALLQGDRYHSAPLHLHQSLPTPPSQAKAATQQLPIDGPAAVPALQSELFHDVARVEHHGCRGTVGERLKLQEEEAQIFLAEIFYFFFYYQHQR